MFSRVATRSVQRRMQSTQKTYDMAFLTYGKDKTFADRFLSDPSTYPLIGTMGCAVVLVVGVAASCLTYSPDVRISFEKRGAVLRSWGLPK
mmetsp:Transcript_23008/g.35221  ORF Transcript_23008/g.35221 Transcript_23008/m.35221 type:complete len:91 (-) Transcript_23008:53-325(-)